MGLDDQYKISKEADEEFCNILVAWENLEKKLESGEIIVDFNLIEWETDRVYNSREEVLTDLAGLMEDETVWADRKIMSRIVAFDAYLGRLITGQTSDYQSYFTDRTGVNLVKIPEERVAAAKQVLVDAMEQAGTAFEEGPKGLGRVSSNIVAVNDIPEWFKERFHQSLEVIERVMGEVPEMKEPIVGVEAPETAMWRAYIRAEGDQFRFAFNSKLVKEESEEGLSSTFNHEVLGHAVQGYYWKKAIENGDMPQSFGLTSVVGPEVLVMEALAEFTSFYYEDDANDISKADHALSDYQRMIWNNAYYMYSYEGVSEEDVKAYLKEELPFRTDEFINNKMSRLIEDSPTYAVYPAVYDVGRRLMQDVMSQLDEAQQHEFLKAIYTSWFDAQDIADLAEEYGVTDIPDFDAERSPKIYSRILPKP